MKTKLYVYYSTSKYIEGMKFYTDKMPLNYGLITLGEIEIDNPFEVPDLSVINNAKIESINTEIKDHKAKIELLENKVKDLLSIENKG